MANHDELTNGVQLETNIDDMDPRLWPAVIEALLAAGARDAWATPIIMKKGRPAFTLHALCTSETSEAVLAAIYRETTTIGVRELPVQRHALEREMSTVDVLGQSVAVKLARADGTIVNRSVEWDDVVAAAAELDMAAKEVLGLATAAAAEL